MTVVIEGPISPDLIDVAGRVLEALGADPDAVTRARGDTAAVRDALALVVAEPSMRAAVLGALAADGVTPVGPVAVLLGDDLAASNGLLDHLRAQIRAHGAAARRAEKAAKRGTAAERRIARLSEDLAAAKRGKTAAENRALTMASQVTTLTGQVGELTEALSDSQERADLQQAATASARTALTNPRVLARHLRSVLHATPDLLTAAGVVVPDVDPAQLAALMDAVLGELADPETGRALAAARAMSVVMLGGGVEVGGSCALVTAGDTRVLVDVGTRPNQTALDRIPPPGLASALAEGPVQAIVITHAHADHAGWVPAVVADQPGVPVYATAPTADLLATMWMDSAKIYARRAGAAPYTRDDVRVALSAVEHVRFGQRVRIGDLDVELFPAGHVLGAAAVWLSDGTTAAIVSGDVSGPGQLSVGGWHMPEHAACPDLLVLESTYGAAAAHTPRAAVVEAFLRDVEVTVAAGGRVLVPAFALGRAQEIAMLLATRLPHVPVLVDGLARDVTEVFERHSGASGEPLSIWSDQVQEVPRGSTSRVASKFRSGVVITTSGMLSAGPALTWAAAILPDPRSLLAIVGYQDPNSPGGRLLELGKTGGVWYLPSLDGDEPAEVDVAARVRTYGLGAHASADELVMIATQVRAKATMLVHGDPSARSSLAQRLAARHLGVIDAGEAWTAAPQA
ncbi:MBL fold metallo-hydrolase [Cellulosimicrobium cellulans]|uniref:MBL fold metallo-hydrolase n=1 Tax=Cellulosimicrobium cellulans TaxID=1710 RepID=UPI0036637620